MSDKTKKYKQSLIDFFGDDNVREWIKVETTEGYVKTSDINQQVRNMQEATIQRGRNNETREEKT